MNTTPLINIPNILSGIRLCLAFPLVYAVLTKNTHLAAFTLVFAASTDWADGYIARRFHLQTQFGAWLDPLADKVVLNAAFIALAYVGIMPVWVALLLFSRDLLITIGAYLYFRYNHRLDGSANAFGKLSTLIQFVVVGWCVLLPQRDVEMIVFALMLFVTLGSGLLYIETWGRLTFRAYQQCIQPKNCE